MPHVMPGPRQLPFAPIAPPGAMVDPAPSSTGSGLQMDLFKTRLCRSFVTTGTCAVGDLCRFAHGHHEIRVITPDSTIRVSVPIGAVANSSAAPGASSDQTTDRKLYVGNIPQGTTEQDLARVLGVFGPIEHVTMPVRKDNPQALQGFGFVTFVHDQSIVAAMTQGVLLLNGTELKFGTAQRKTWVEPAWWMTHSESRIWIGNIIGGLQFEKWQLESYFSKFGAVAHLHVPWKDGLACNFGYVHPLPHTLCGSPRSCCCVV
jgi:hypothetical protein